MPSLRGRRTLAGRDPVEPAIAAAAIPLPPGMSPGTGTLTHHDAELTTEHEDVRKTMVQGDVPNGGVAFTQHLRGAAHALVQEPGPRRDAIRAGEQTREVGERQVDGRRKVVRRQPMAHMPFDQVGDARAASLVEPTPRRSASLRAMDQAEELHENSAEGMVPERETRVVFIVEPCKHRQQFAATMQQERLLPGAGPWRSDIAEAQVIEGQRMGHRPKPVHDPGRQPQHRPGSKVQPGTHDLDLAREHEIEYVLAQAPGPDLPSRIDRGTTKVFDREGPGRIGEALEPSFPGDRLRRHLFVLEKILGGPGEAETP